MQFFSTPDIPQGIKSHVSSGESTGLHRHRTLPSSQEGPLDNAARGGHSVSSIKLLGNEVSLLHRAHYKSNLLFTTFNTEINHREPVGKLPPHDSESMSLTRSHLPVRLRGPFHD